MPESLPSNIESEQFFAHKNDTERSDKETQEQPIELEFELTPEAEAEIMRKVQDIYQEGTAYSLLRIIEPLEIKSYETYEITRYKSLENATEQRKKDRRERLESLFSIGLIRTGYPLYLKENPKEAYRIFKGYTRSAEYDPEEQRQPYSLDNSGGIFFNVVGRFGWRNPYHYERHDMEPYPREDIITAIFDISSFRELQDPTEKISVHTYRPTLANDVGKKLVEASFGFYTPHRIAPRFLRGIVLGKPTGANIRSILEPMFEVGHEKPDRFLPIYDHEGNMVWPRQMTRQEIIDFVAEGDKKK